IVPVVGADAGGIIMISGKRRKRDTRWGPRKHIKLGKRNHSRGKAVVMASEVADEALLISARFAISVRYREEDAIGVLRHLSTVEDKPYKPLPLVDIPCGLGWKQVDQLMKEIRLED
ncbi:hypothetical protein FOZ62_015841, partial [Perkinsus olseni]